jgi:hypothetical protein
LSVSARGALLHAHRPEVRTAAPGDTHSFRTPREGGAMPYGDWINELPTEFFLVVQHGTVIVR